MTDTLNFVTRLVAVGESKSIKLTLEPPTATPLKTTGTFWIALGKIIMYHSIYNVRAYLTDEVLIENAEGNTSGPYYIPPGFYSVQELCRIIENYASDSGVASPKIEYSMDKIGRVSLTPNFTIKTAGRERTVMKLLGFPSQIAHGDLTMNEENTSPYPAELDGFSYVGVECGQLRQGMYVDNANKPLLYIFSPRVNRNFKILEVPQELSFYPLLGSEIGELEFALVDQDGRKLQSLPNEKVYIELVLKTSPI